MTVRELLELVAPTIRILIKPSGKKIYFEGKSSDAPESLMDTTVLEISARLNDDDALVLCIWVEHNGTWDLMIEGIPDMRKFPDMADAWYFQITEYPEIFKKDVLDGIAKNRTQRMTRYWESRGNTRPTTEELRKWIEEQKKGKQQIDILSDIDIDTSPILDELLEVSDGEEF